MKLEEIIKLDKELREKNLMSKATNYFVNGNTVYAELPLRNPVKVAINGKHITH